MRPIAGFGSAELPQTTLINFVLSPPCLGSLIVFSHAGNFHAQFQVIVVFNHVGCHQTPALDHGWCVFRFFIVRVKVGNGVMRFFPNAAQPSLIR